MNSVAPRSHHGNDTRTQTIQRLDSVPRGHSHPKGVRGASPGVQDFCAPNGSGEQGEAPRSSAGGSCCAHAHPTGCTQARRADPLVYRHIRDDLQVAAKQTNASRARRAATMACSSSMSWPPCSATLCARAGSLIAALTFAIQSSWTCSVVGAALPQPVTARHARAMSSKESRTATSCGLFTTGRRQPRPGRRDSDSQSSCPT